MSERYDVAVIGGGPVGCVSALEFARRGARVLLLEANPRASQRLAGEWLHPLALAQLRRLGIDLPTGDEHADARGFAVFPDDGSDPMVLQYGNGARGICCEHDRLVGLLRARVETDSGVRYLPFARATEIISSTASRSGNGPAAIFSASVWPSTNFIPKY